VDWRPFYRAEAESERGRARVRAAVGRFPAGDPAVREALRRGGAASFPHVTLAESAEPLARVATSVLAEGFERVVALGVLHASSLPEAERALAMAAAEGDDAALSAVGGLHVAEGDAETPFGSVPAGPSPKAGPACRPGRGRLEAEFSLDLFLAVLAAAAGARGAPPPPVTRAFCGPVAAARADGGLVAAVAASLRPLLGPRTALVATGDLVHAGHGYSKSEETAALPRDEETLRAGLDRRARAMVEATLRGGHGVAEGDAAARSLRSDARHVLPVLGALVGPGARPRTLSFRLADYAAILGRPRPCVVASALLLVER
jgi:hypothetical protein